MFCRSSHRGSRRAAAEAEFAESGAEAASGEGRAVVRAERQLAGLDQVHDGGALDERDRLVGATPELELPGDDLAGAAVDDRDQVGPAVVGDPDWVMSSCQAAGAARPGRSRAASCAATRATTDGQGPSATSSRERATRCLTPTPARVFPRSPARRSCGRAPAPARPPSGAAPARPGVPPCRLRHYAPPRLPGAPTQLPVNAGPGSGAAGESTRQFRQCRTG
jgi:hypothetical protein